MDVFRVSLVLPPTPDLSIVGAMSDTCRGFDTLPLLLMGLQASLVLIPKDAELAHEPLWRLRHLYPRWLLLRLLPHLLHPSKSLEVAPEFYFASFFAYDCLHPAALKESFLH